MPKENPVRYSTIHVVLTFQSHNEFTMSTVSQGLRITSWVKLAIGFSALSVFSTLLYRCSYHFCRQEKSESNWEMSMARHFNSIVLTILGTKLNYLEKTTSTQPIQPYLSNHSSQLDPLVAIQLRQSEDVASQKKRSSTFHFSVGHTVCLVTSL